MAQPAPAPMDSQGATPADVFAQMRARIALAPLLSAVLAHRMTGHPGAGPAMPPPTPGIAHVSPHGNTVPWGTKPVPPGDVWGPNSIGVYGHTGDGLPPDAGGPGGGFRMPIDPVPTPVRRPSPLAAAAAGRAY